MITYNWPIHWMINFHHLTVKIQHQRERLNLSFSISTPGPTPIVCHLSLFPSKTDFAAANFTTTASLFFHSLRPTSSSLASLLLLGQLPPPPFSLFIFLFPLSLSLSLFLTPPPPTLSPQLIGLLLNPIFAIAFLSPSTLGDWLYCCQLHYW